MQDSATNESYPTHPLGKRDSWPATGPIYGIPEQENEPEPTRTIWQRLVSGTPEVSENVTTRAGDLPIWY